MSMLADSGLMEVWDFCMKTEANGLVFGEISLPRVDGLSVLIATSVNGLLAIGPPPPTT